MATALVVQHGTGDGPGLLAEWLPAAGLDLDVVCPYAGGRLPDRLRHDALIVLGGSQSATNDDPVTRAELSLLRDATAGSRPVLGVCLGGQLLARATGGQVRAGEHGPEIGVRLVRKADAASRDPVFGGLPFLPDVVEWHWDEITVLPPGAVLLASGALYPHQAFRLGERAYGLQFHIEPTMDMLAAWATGEGLDPALVVEEFGGLDLAATWRAPLEAFAALA
jgi:GMP synthase-like glutamine amidotransferase